MSENQNEPTEYDAVKGGQNLIPVNAAVLGGIGGVKSRLASPNVEVKIAALSEALKYGESGLDLIIQALQDESMQLKSSAYLMVKDIYNDPLVIKKINKYARNIFEFDVITVDADGKENSRQKSFSFYFSENLNSSVVLPMVYIPGGTFMMGSPETETGRRDDESPQHQVTVPAFYAGKYPVTQAQWQAVMGYNLSYYEGEKRPVDSVSWLEAVEFCRRLSEKTGKSYRLLSEAEWEYACRAGTTTPFYFGDTIMSDMIHHQVIPYSTIDPQHKGSASRSPSTDVGIFPPNLFGLYDMHGNVCEWCSDTWHDNYNGAPTDGSSWETETNNQPMYRGKGGSLYKIHSRSAYRNRGAEDSVNCIGFRVAVAFDLALSMSENQNEPRECDAVKSDQNLIPVNAAVLGGIGGVKSRLASPNVEVKIAALSEALKYGESGLDLIIQALQDESMQIEFAAYSLLKNRNEEKIKQHLLNKSPLFKFDLVPLDRYRTENGRQDFFVEDLGNSILLEMLYIPGGTFMMGSVPEHYHHYRKKHSIPQHQVTVPAFYAGKYAITQPQWGALMDNDPSRDNGVGDCNKLSVNSVTWDDAVEFCRKLSEKTGKSYRLLSEAEWEYACRAGTTTPFYFGDTITPYLVNYSAYTHGEHPKPRHLANCSCGSKMPVGCFPPNSFGLYDMHGNIYEWCSDRWHDDYKGAPTDGSSWETGTDDRRVFRGGSSGSMGIDSGSAVRQPHPGIGIYTQIGFRVALALP